ncbi:cytosolic regulator pianissimo [Moesziomyces antarcticus]|uniref:Cytosolic regulator pianissimo n=2 Tax=Pseudozyma antarctica TaxID=84753 RepID=A0A081CLM6_PSEA2|nr:cytosolic regulator pianissimo [Moesziomyces antarcticus]GAK67572.1 cytosolic regulator pianissimo [Moesziomyces antarcticus]SPO48837.1 related to protein ste16 [Moesziomyces antarcticus]
MASNHPNDEVHRIQNQIDIETKIKDGAENLLSVFDLKLATNTKHDLRRQIESELDSANANIASLTSELQRWRQIHADAQSPHLSNYASDAISSPPVSTSSASWQIPHSTVSRLEQSALGYDGQPLFAARHPPPAHNDSDDHLANHHHHHHPDTSNGSPPSTNYVNHLASAVDANAQPFGGLGIGLDAHAPLALSNAANAQSLDSHTNPPPPLLFQQPSAQPSHHASTSKLPYNHDREVEDARASRSLALMLIRSLRPSSPMPPPTQLPTLAEQHQHQPHATDTADPLPAPTTDPDSPLNSALALPRMTRRTAARSRAAAIASGASSHARTPSNAAGLGDQAKHHITQINRLVDILKRHARVRYELPLDDLVDAAMPNLCDRAGKEIRAATYRLLRYALVQPLWPLVSRCRQKGLDIYLSRSLIRDNRFELEKVQCIRLIRAIMDMAALRSIAASPDRLAMDLQDLLATGVIRALAAVADHADDKLRHICLETLAELAVFDIRLLIKAGGLRTTLQALTEGASDFSPALVQVFIYLIDMPGTRHHLRPGVDLEIALSGFTEAPVQKPITYDALLRSTASVVTVLLRSWAGLIYLCMDDKRSIKSLVQALRVNAIEVKSVLLDMLYDLFNVRGVTGRVDPASKRESSQKAASSSPKLDADAASGAAHHANMAPLGELGDQPRSRLNLVDHYLALLLVVFLECGLVDALIDVIEHAPLMARKATMLMGELLQVSKRVHPPSMGGSIHSLPRLFSLAADFRLDKSDERQAAAQALSTIDSANRHRAHHEAVTSAAALSGTVQSTARDRSNSIEESMRRGQRQVEKTKMRIGMQIDDVQFRNMMVDTQVLVTKDHTKWNLDTLTDMLEGPLLNPKRLEDVVRGSKLLKRVLAFYHPFALRFSSIRRLNANRRFVRLGCLLLSTLAATQEGLRVLAEDRLLRELRECLDQLDPLSGQSGTDALFSRKRMTETLACGYFEMIGVLTQSSEGIKLLERCRIFTPLYHLSELRSRDDIVKAVIENVDYSIEGHSRIVLAKALTSSYRDVRLFATRHLAELIRQQTLPANAKNGAEVQGDWTIGLLLTQLYDPSVEVRQLATRVVQEACTSAHMLEKVVAMRPTLDHLGELGHPLLLKFLSTSVGIRYLWHGEYIDREMDEWFNERNQRYVVEVEVMLAEFFSMDRKSPAGGAADKAAGESGWAATPATWGVEPMQEGVVPAHFYGELTKTREGCHILTQKGHFGEFAHLIRQHGSEASDSELISKLKSVLWAVGSIGANELGLPFLEAEDVVSQIVEIAETSAVLSVRGTCFFVLGLISSTNAGAEVLQDYGWQSVCTPLGAPMGLCIPDNVNRLVSLPRWQVEQVADLGYLEFEEPQTVVVNKIITSIANLGNSILAANASRSLNRLKAKHARAFQDMAVLARAVELMDHFNFRVAVRRYVWELFDVSLDEGVVDAIQTSRQQLVEAKRARTTQQSKQDRRSSRAESLDAHNGGAEGWESGSGSDGAGESDEAEDEVGLSSNMSSDDEASDTSQDEAKLADDAVRPLARAAVRRPSMRSSTLKGHWTRTELAPAKVVATPVKKVLGFGVESL